MGGETNQKEEEENGLAMPKHSAREEILSVREFCTDLTTKQLLAQQLHTDFIMG